MTPMQLFKDALDAWGLEMGREADVARVQFKDDPATKLKIHISVSAMQDAVQIHGDGAAKELVGHLLTQVFNELCELAATPA